MTHKIQNLEDNRLKNNMPSIVLQSIDVIRSTFFDSYKYTFGFYNCDNTSKFVVESRNPLNVDINTHIPFDEFIELYKKSITQSRL